MKLEVVRLPELSAADLARWSEWQSADRALASPYFHADFTRAIAEVRDDVFVAVLEEGAAFLPFQSGRDRIGRPVGGIISDYHGAIARPGFSFDAEEVIRRAGLRAWDFDHLPAAQASFARWATVQTHSPLLDLTQPGAGASKSWREQIARRRAKLAHEAGDIEVEFSSADDAAFEQALAWKSAQYLASGAPDLFAPGWVREVVSRLRAARAVEFGAVFSVLRAGGKPLAAHFGLRSRGVLHYWFPAYDPAFSASSPGIMLLLAMIEAAPAHGLRAIDFGKGDAVYKQRLANTAVPLLEGGVVASPSLRVWRRSRDAARAWLRRSPLLPVARGIRRWLRR